MRDLALAMPGPTELPFPPLLNGSSAIEVGQGVSTAADARQAGTEAARQALASIAHHALSAVLVYASPHYKLAAALDGIHRVVGGAPVIGVTTAGEICGGMHQRSIVVIALASPHLSVSCGLGTGVSLNWRDAIEQATAAPGIKAYCAGSDPWLRLAREGKTAFGMLFSPGNTRQSDCRCYEMLEAIKLKLLGQMPVMLGGAGDYWRMEQNYVLLGQQAYADTVLLAVFETKLQFGIALAHGFRPTAARATVTGVQDHEVLALDGEPAAAVYARLLGMTCEELAGKHLTLTTGRPFGTADPMGQFSVNAPSYITARGGIRFTQPLSPGTVLTLMEPDGDAMMRAGQDAVRKAILRGGIAEPAVGLVHYCALRSALMGGPAAEREIQAAAELAGGAPVGGFHSFGEGGVADDGVSRFSNAAVAALVLGRGLSPAAQAVAENERLRDELGQYAHLLERRVEERTADLECRDAILAAVAQCATELLGSADLEHAMDRVLELLGRAVGADAARVYENRPDQDGRVLHALRNEWSAPGIPALIAQPGRQDINLEASGRGDLQQALERDVPVCVVRSKTEGKLRRQLEERGTCSCLLVPVFVGTEAWGVVSLVHTRIERQWTSLETDALRMLATMLGSAIERARDLRRLTDALRIVENSPTVLFRARIGPGFPITYISENISRFGFSARQICAAHTPLTDLVHPDDLSDVQRTLHTAIESSRPQVDFTFRGRTGDGGWRWFGTRMAVLRSAAGKVTGLQGVNTDITERKQAEDELNFSNVLLTTAFESSPDGILVVDTDRRVLSHNRRFLEMFKLPEEYAGLDLAERMRLLTVLKDPGGYALRSRHLYDHPEEAGNDELELGDGRIFDQHIASLYDAERQYLGRIWFFRDITERKAAEQKIAALARTDALTGLANRSTFQHRLAEAFAARRRGAAPFAVLYLDLDNFKVTNDTLGHAAGDAVLQSVAARLVANVREMDVAARLGGDEFAVIQVEPQGPEIPAALAQRLLEVLSAPHEVGNYQFKLGVSIGIAMADDHGDPDRLLARADMALYAAKAAGRGVFRFFEPAMEAALQSRRALELDLRAALRDHEFELFYQPVVELRSGRVGGFEALLRWPHSAHGMIPPSEFIPLAEEIGLIAPLGEWVLERACFEAATWPADVSLAVNLSPVQLGSRNLPHTVAVALARSGLPARRLELEITETALLQQNDATPVVLQELRALGVRIALDDFGTGFSSLSTLRAFPFDRIKIDQSFVRDLSMRADAAAIVSAVAGLAAALGMATTAEGVETGAQLARVRAGGCTDAQGYLFSRPVRPAEVPGLLSAAPHLPAAYVEESLPVP